jgi:type I restriction enzyme S subunit
MESDLSKEPLGELAQNLDARRIPLSSRERAKRRGPFPYYGATGVVDFVDDYLFDGLHLLVAEDGSVERTDGKPFLQLVNGRFWVNNHAHVLKAETDEDTRFLYYALSTVAIRPYISGSVQAKLSQANLSRIRVPYLAKRKDRCAVVDVLGTLDDKIDLHRRMNETLEAIARAAFQSWFVDFDPVRAKASGEADESTCRRLGLSAEELELFPDRLNDLDMGEIPDGWAPGTIKDLCELNARTWTTRTVPAVVHYIDLANVKSGVVSKVQVLTSSSAPSRARRALRPGDTIVGTVRPGNRSFALIGACSEQLTASTGFAVLSPKRVQLRELIYLLSTSRENIAKLSHLADGAAYPAVHADVVASAECVIPPSEVIDAFNARSKPLFDLLLANQANSIELAETRDALLPRLLSGDIRVPLDSAT